MAKRKRKVQKPRVINKISPGLSAMENIVMDLPATAIPQPAPSQQMVPKKNLLPLILIVGIGIVVLLAVGAAAVFLAAQL